MSLFTELKRRNVIRVGLAYVVTAWLVSQVGELAADSFEAPAWVMKMFITLLGLGFPFALIFAWAFELTPEGLKKEKDVDRTRSIAQTTGRKLDLVIIAILSIALIYFAYDKFLLTPDATPTPELSSTAAQTSTSVIPDRAEHASELSSTAAQTSTSVIPDRAKHASGTQTASAATTPHNKSIAVLPFSNRSAGGENTLFLSDGIHDDLLTNLSKIHELRVISRTSVMAYRDTTKNMREVGEELGVANLLEGAVQQAGNRVRINVQLINAFTDENVWAESYDRDVSAENLFDIQGEIARAIAGALEATLSPEETERLGHMPTTNLEAYEAVLLSRQFARRGGFDALLSAIENGRKAIELDPAYADAHLALAFALIQSINTGLITDQQAGAEISTAIDSAMSLNPSNDAVWAMLGHYQAVTGKAGAGESFEKAMQLNPGNVQTLFAFGDMLHRNGQPDQALPLLLRASELDPLSLGVIFSLGRTYEGLDQPVNALEAYARLRKIDPASPLGYAPSSGAYFSVGQIDQSLYWLDRGQSIDPQDFEIGAWMVFINATLEDYVASGAWSDWLASWVTNQPAPMSAQALHHYIVGDFELAVQYSNIALNLGLDDRWGSDAIFMRIKRDEALATGEPAAGIDVFHSRHPELFAEPPEIVASNLQQAVDLAFLLKLSGRQDEMQGLLEAAIAFYDKPWAVSGSTNAYLASAKAEALAIMEDEPGALHELRRIKDKGWRLFWRWETELNHNFNGVREFPEFREMLSELQADMAFQRANAHAMAARGEIKPVPRAAIPP